jgi:hypothetical protein
VRERGRSKKRESKREGRGIDNTLALKLEGERIEKSFSKKTLKNKSVSDY